MIDSYFERFGFCRQQIGSDPHADLGLVIVIPCRREPALPEALESLWKCTRPESAVEIIVVVNSAESDPAADRAENERTLVELAQWQSEHPDPRFVLHAIHAPNLPQKTAGVGLARKIGMDEALRRFERASGQPGRQRGVIACFDADCACDSNYLVEVERFFVAHPQAPGCSIYFEHPLEGPEDRRIYEAIALYELHLRYYVQALRYAGFPHAFQTVGSSMAVRAHAYLEQGGMNRRQAGEDFYFLHKIIPLGQFGEVSETRVIPSPRVSDRVPFGTGKAVADYLAQGQMQSYPLQAFEDLRALFTQAAALYQQDPAELPAPLETFLREQEFAAALEEIRANCRSPESFTRRFFRWFDAFRVMKCIHFARDRHYGAPPVAEAARALLDREEFLAPGRTPAHLLQAYRHLQRRPWPQKSAEPLADSALAKELFAS